MQTNFKMFCGIESQTSAFKVVTALFPIYNKTVAKQISCDDKTEFRNLMCTVSKKEWLKKLSVLHQMSSWEWWIWKRVIHG